MGLNQDQLDAMGSAGFTLETDGWNSHVIRFQYEQISVDLWRSNDDDEPLSRELLIERISEAAHKLKRIAGTLSMSIQ